MEIDSNNGKTTAAASAATPHGSNGNGNGNANGATQHANNSPPFTSQIASAIVSANAGENVIISPLQLEALLTLLYLGSDGHTAEELKRVLQLQSFSSNAKMAQYFATELHLSADRTADTHMQLCSELVLPECCDIADEFRKIAQNYFHTAVVQCQAPDGSAPKLRAQLNEDLAKVGAAEGYVWRISETAAVAAAAALTAETEPVAKSSSSSTSSSLVGLVLAAVHFQNKWFLPFSAYRTGIYDFQMSAVNETNNAQTPAAATTTTTTATVAIPMLFDDDMFVKFAEFRELDARAIELPYEHDDELSMLIVLPNRKDGLSALERQLQSIDLTALAERMQMESVQVLLPKFQIDFECNLRRVLEELGITQIFSKAANFKNMLRDGSTTPLAFADILHKVCIEVNESGTDGAHSVVYKPIVISNSMDSRKKFFRADHPFYFAIRCRDVTLFVGHITKF